MSAQPPRKPLERSEIEKAAVVTQLERILEHPAFRGSVRSAKFLRYAVDYWLENERDGEQLKERTVGVELFGLDLAYDPSHITIVRNTAVDVRKRLAVYYGDPAHSEEIQLALPVGSYIPQVYLPDRRLSEIRAAGHSSQDEHAGESSGATPEAFAGPLKQLDRRRFVFQVPIVLAAVAAAILGGIMIGRHRNTRSEANQGDSSSIHFFWQPVLTAKTPEPVILVCIGQLSQVVGGEQVTPTGNADALVAIARLLDLEGATFRLEDASAIAAEQVRMSTMVLIGGPENPLILYEGSSLRFRINSQQDQGSDRTVWIEDQNNRSNRGWTISSSSQSSEEYTDYAILARFKNPVSGQWRVFASGLNGVGTSIASEILVAPNTMQELTRQLPVEWRTKNVEMVIKVEVVKGRAGYPQLAAYEIW
jgi:hypothetical protein